MLTWTRWEAEIAIFATFALFAIELAAARALAGHKIANVIQRACEITITGQTIRSVVAVSASITEMTSEIGFARARAVD